MLLHVCVLWCLLHTVSACCTCRMCWLYVCVVVPGAHLVLSVLAALGICVIFCGAWSAPRAVSACCTCRMCWLYVCVEMLGVHLVLSVLAALGICVGYMWCLECTYELAICIVGCLARTWCKRRVTLVKFQTFPMS